MGIRIVSLFIFVLLVIVFFYDRIIGIRALGLVTTLIGVYWLKMGRIPYGWRGRPAAGYLTGWMAVTVAVSAIGLGILFLAEPKFIDVFAVASNSR